MKKILHSENLSIGYSSPIASDIDISVCSGKLVSLIGANGIGKSTLLRTITGLQNPISGTILLDGEPLQKMSASEIAKKISVVLTEKLPPSNLTVYELVASGRHPYTNWIGSLAPQDKKCIDDAIQITGIESLVNKKSHQLSDGQLQTVMIARALAQDTPIIVLDEPSTHLDIVHKAKLFRLLKKLAHEQQKAILFSTHDIELALETSDEIIMMAGGKTIQENTVDFIRGNHIRNLFEDPDIQFDPEKVKFVFKNL